MAYLKIRAGRIGIAALVLAASAVPLLSGHAAGGESLSDLKDRMAEIRSELDATTAEILALEAEQAELHDRMEEIGERTEVLEKKRDKLQEDAIARADELYRSGSAGMFEVLLGSEDVSELATRAELLSQVSTEDAAVFVELSRAESELAALSEELAAKEDTLSANEDALDDRTAQLQSQFDSVSAEYEELREKLAALQPAPAPPPPPPAPEKDNTRAAPPPPAPAPVKVPVSGNMTCPVAGPVSFVDSWLAPRVGHLHQGVDMMADYGTPVVAITSGTVSASWDDSGGNMIFLSGDDGNAYWYMHNQQNIITSGHVSVGQQIATVGDTGNATGSPHVHFEYHPGGGSAVNPYPLVAGLC